MESVMYSPTFWFLSPSGLLLHSRLCQPHPSDHTANSSALSCQSLRSQSGKSLCLKLSFATSLPLRPMLNWLCPPLWTWVPWSSPLFQFICLHDLICLFPQEAPHTSQEGFSLTSSTLLPFGFNNVYPQPLLNRMVFIFLLLAFEHTGENPDCVVHYTWVLSNPHWALATS